MLLLIRGQERTALSSSRRKPGEENKVSYRAVPAKVRKDKGKTHTPELGELYPRGGLTLRQALGSGGCRTREVL